jgi:hypothetical protein
MHNRITYSERDEYGRKRINIIPYGKTILVTLAPMFKDGQCLGCVQSVVLKEEIDSVLT